MKNTLEFNFGGKEVPLYDEIKGYGFVAASCAIMARTVDVSKIEPRRDTFVITETDFSRFEEYEKKENKIECPIEQNNKKKNIDYHKDYNSKNGEKKGEDKGLIDSSIDDWETDYKKLEIAPRYDLGGMIFRVKVPAGTYRIELETTRGEAHTLVSVSGLRGTQLLKEGYWDAANLVPIRYPAKWVGNTWTYEYVNSREYIDIEVEPLAPYIEVGIKKLTITPSAIKVNRKEEKPTVFILGDSTVKSYVFEEAPMCGWGQLLDHLFDLEQINIVNYSAGGRSFKVMNFEGRLNDALLAGKQGDYILLQSGHNDERDTFEEGETARFGRGTTEEMYQRFLEEIYLPTIRIRGMIPVFVTPMTRVNEGVVYDGKFHNSFVNRKFPDVMRQVAAREQIPLIDLNARSVDYINEIGKEGAEAIVLSIEAGETPGKTNSGSFANGNPTGKIDGTHMKEALAKRYARIVAEELYYLTERFEILKPLERTFKEKVRDAIHTNDWSLVYPEICRDVLSGEGAYYRNQIEKMVQLEILRKDSYGNFNPQEEMTIETFEKALLKLYSLPINSLESYRNESCLTREVMGAMLLDAYELKFYLKGKPKYMTDYNGTNVTPDDPQYDPNLIGKEAQYYPMIGYECLKDISEVSLNYREKLNKAYNLGLIRSEHSIERGKMQNGDLLEPKKVVTKAKAAKALYFMWVLCHDIKSENHCGLS